MLLFSSEDVLWAVEECERQKVGPMKVHYLLRALKHARNDIFKKPTLDEIAYLGYLVEPDHNLIPQESEVRGRGLWRNVGVTIGGVVPLPAPSKLDRLMENLLDGWGHMKADEWYKEFEEIHPFADGNGRVGSILWNLHRGSIRNPKAPPDFWSEDNQALIEESNRKAYMEISDMLFRQAHGPDDS